MRYGITFLLVLFIGFAHAQEDTWVQDLLKKADTVQMPKIEKTAPDHIFLLQQETPISIKLAETSGLLFYNSKVITHNDSGGKPRLFVLNPTSGEITKKVKVSNAENIDWEDLAEDKKHIYIADTGNNNGDRKDLVIYKIKKKEFLKSKKVKAEMIKFTYEDQTDFTSVKHRSNFDCEAITVYKNQLLLFTKNWIDEKTNIYALSLKKGTHVAKKIHSIDTKAMITSVAYHKSLDQFVVTAYNKKFESSVIRIKNFNTAEQELIRTPLTDHLGYGNQIEGIDWKNSHKVFFTREAHNKKVDGINYQNPQKLFLLDLSK